MITTKTMSSNFAAVLPAAAATVAAAVLLPVLVHLLPAINNVPMGVRLLPIYYAPLLALFFFQPTVAILASLAAPLLNHLLTGNPTSQLALMLTLELTIFILLMKLSMNRWPRLVVAAPIAFLLAKGLVLLVLIILPVTLTPAPPIPFVTNQIVNAWPGLVILTILNLLAVQYAQRTDGR